MKKAVFAGLFAVSIMVANAQVRLTLSYTKNWLLTTADSAVYKRVCIYDTLNSYFAGPFVDLYKSGRPQMKGTYIGKRKEGEFTTYYDNGAIESVGKFESDQRVGIWKFFFPNGKLKMEVNCIPSLGEPMIVVAYDSTGIQTAVNGTGKFENIIDRFEETIKVSGKLKGHMKDGTWQIINLTTQERFEEEYDEGKWIRSFRIVGNKREHFIRKNLAVLVPLPDKFLFTENFSAKPDIDFSIYPKLNRMMIGEETLYRVPRPEFTIKAEVQPELKGGVQAMMTFISRNLKYPPKARSRNIQGSVFVEFIVNEDGTASGFNIIKGIGGGCDEEALRVVEKLSAEVGWIPGKTNGKPIKTRFVIPLKFVLG